MKKRGPKTSKGKAKVLANLRKFQPGQSGNPGGRPKKTKLTDAAREWLELIDPKTGLTNAQSTVAATGKEALRGNTAAFNALADRTEGRPSQSIAVSGEVGLDFENIDSILAEYTRRIRARAAQGKGKA